MANCAYCTSVVGFLIFSRGHLDDQAISECINVNRALDFFPKALNMNVYDIIHLFDNYITMQALSAFLTSPLWMLTNIVFS